MSACACCGQPKSDVVVRPLVRAYDYNGGRTTRPFEGPLCQGCCDKTQQFGTREHSWLLKQLIEPKPASSSRAS
jgi:hypothetical protein